MHFNLIDYITQEKGLKLPAIAEKLGVTRTLVSKWKKGEPPSEGNMAELMKLAGLFGKDPEWAAFVQTPKNQRAWFDYIASLASEPDDFGNNYSGYKFEMEPEIWTVQLLLCLRRLGLDLPPKPPSSRKPNIAAVNELDAFFAQALQYYEFYSKWCAVKLDLSFADEMVESIHSEFRNELEAIIIEMVIARLPEDLMESVGVDPDEFGAIASSSKLNVCMRIRDYCQLLRAHAAPIWVDYYDFVNREPEDLAFDVEYDTLFEIGSIEELLPIGERRILIGLRKNERLLHFLHQKMDLVIPDAERESINRDMDLEGLRGSDIDIDEFDLDES